MATRRIFTLGLLLIVAFAAAVSAGYESDVEAWRKGRLERLLSKSGYLSITGLFWLHEGVNTFGGAASNDMVFPGKDVPEHIGRVIRNGEQLRVVIEPGIAVTHDGEPVDSMIVYDDNDAEHGPTRLQLGTLTWYPIRRGDRYGVRLKDTESPAIKNFRGIEHYPVDPKWRFEAKFKVNDPLLYIPITNEVGVTTNEPCWGAIVFDVNGKTCRLDALAKPGDESLFVIFADETNGVETYGAGRFVYVDAPDEEGNVVIDFNEAYNPPCAFSQFTTCPRPPQQNTLPFKVTAGEKAYVEHEAGSDPGM